MAKRKAIKEKFNKKLIPLLLLMFVPLIMYSQNIKFDTVITNPYYLTAESYTDMFSFYKSIAIYVSAILCIVFYILYTNKKNVELKKERLKYYIPVSIYAVFIILSTIFAIYPKVAIFGFYDRFEGALVLISYLIFMVYAIEVIRDDYDLKYIFRVFLFVVFILSAIGVLQKYLFDIFSFEFVQKLIGVSGGSSIDFTFNKMAYATLYNPNNLGQFAALTVPITAGILFVIKSKIGKIFAVLTLIVAIVAGFASNSDNFTAGIIVSSFFFFILFASNLIPRNKNGKIIFFTSLFIICIVFAVFSGKIWDKFYNTEYVQKQINSILPKKTEIYFEDILCSDEVISLVTNKGTFTIRYLESGISFYDPQMEFMEFNQSGAQIRFQEEPYKTWWIVNITSDNTMDVSAKTIGRSTLTVVFDDEKFLGIQGTGGIIIRDEMKNQMPEKFKGLETIASNRGYMWIVTFSRLDKVIFLGAGPDSFIYWFDQNDIAGKLNHLRNTKMLVDKPHNWYLQIGSQTGVISLLTFLALTGIYIISSIKLLGIKRKKDYYEFLSAGILCGIVGFMVSSFFVDSTVGVTPIFFVFLGIGIMTNEKIKKNRYKEQNLDKRKK